MVYINCKLITVHFMLNQLDVLALKYRCKLILTNLRTSNSGADAHEVGNMMHQAQAILDCLDGDCEDLVMKLVQRLEERQLQFFYKKFNLTMDASKKV